MKAREIDKLSVIVQSPWFVHLPDEAITSLVESSRWRHYPKSTLVHAKGDESTGVFCIVFGRLRASHTTQQGQEVILTDFEPGFWFGELGLNDSGTRTHDVFAKEDTAILFIPRATLLSVGEKWPQLYKGLFQELVNRTRLIYDLLDISHQGIPLKTRLAFRLLNLLKIHGQESPEGIILEIELTQSDLARLCNSSRQLINQTLKLWAKQGILHYKRKNITILDLAALQSEADN